MKAKKIKAGDLFKILVFIFLIVYALSMLTPFVWGVCVSFMDQTQYTMKPLALPEQWHFENYVKVFRQFSKLVGDKYLYIEDLLLNTVLFSVGCALINTFVICVTAYVSAKFDFWFCKALEKVVIIVMIVPIVGSLPSEIQVSKSLGLYDTMTGMYIMRSSFLGMYFLVFKGMFKGIPDDYRDAAYIDGSNNYTVFFKIMLPMISLTFKTVALLSFINYWNDYQTPLVYLPSHPTLALGLFEFNSSNNNEIAIEPIKLAACFTIFLPILILFLFTNEKLMGNLQMGGLKG